MNRIKVAAVGFACVAVLFGCVVQSVHPFFTKEAVVPIPEGMKGEWKIIEESGSKVEKEIAPWVFSDKEITTVQGNDDIMIKSDLETVYFKVGDKLFVDCTAGDPGKAATKSINYYWGFSIARIHHVCKVEFSGDKLSLIPLSYEWMYKNIEDKKISLPYMTRELPRDDGQIFLFTASSKEWMAFLEKYGSDNEAFNPKLAFKFKRSSPLPGSPPPTPKQP